MKHILLALALAVVAHAQTKLNLLYITADDMNADSPGWMGGKMNATPTLDALAGTCHRFINNHVTAPICQPSREAMFTGRVPHRSGALGFNPIKPGTPTLATVLKNSGYFIAAINKTPHMKPEAEFPWDDKIEGSGKNPPLLREHFESTLKHASEQGKPFFINVNIQYPHRPFPGSNAADPEEGAPSKGKGKAKGTLKKERKQASTKTEGLARIYTPEEIIVPDFLEDIPPVRKELAQYWTAVAQVDVCLKGVLEALAASGHDTDTIVVFMSDHGMSFPFSKATVYYNGTHSPVILKWPNMPAATVHEELVSSVDIMPTLLEIMNVTKPDGMDGRSWLPLINGQKQDGRDYVITHVNTVSSGMSLPQRCIRTKDWALLFHSWVDGKAKFKVEAMSGITYNAMAKAAGSDEKIAGRVKQLRVGEPLMFFNEHTDTAERSNAVNDANYKTEIERLAGLLLDHMKKTEDPEAANFTKALDDWRKAAK
jgi:N-sulfoglucosamine sulfohydrolase